MTLLKYVKAVIPPKKSVIPTLFCSHHCGWFCLPLHKFSIGVQGFSTVVIPQQPPAAAYLWSLTARVATWAFPEAPSLGHQPRPAWLPWHLLALVQESCFSCWCQHCKLLRVPAVHNLGPLPSHVEQSQLAWHPYPPPIVKCQKSWLPMQIFAIALSVRYLGILKGEISLFF